MSILFAQTFVVPLQFQDTIAVPAREGLPRWMNCFTRAMSSAITKRFHFRCLSTFSAFYSVHSVPVRVWLCRFCEVYFALDLLRLLIHLKSSIVSKVGSLLY